jgi:hypothetical protein
MESVSIIVKGNVQKICSKVFFVYTGKNKNLTVRWMRRLVEGWKERQN